MRTTLDIDDDVLQAAKELARQEKKTAGEVLSELARKALTGDGASPSHGKLIFKDGWYSFPPSGSIVTTEMVEQLLDQADWEDAGLSKPVD